MSQRQRLFGEWLIALNGVTPSQLDKALAAQSERQEQPGNDTVPYIGEILRKKCVRATHTGK